MAFAEIKNTNSEGLQLTRVRHKFMSISFWWEWIQFNTSQLVLIQLLPVSHRESGFRGPTRPAV